MPPAELVPAGELVLGLLSLIFPVLELQDNADFLMTSTVLPQAGLTELQGIAHLVSVDQVHLYEERATCDMSRQVGKLW